MLVIYDDAAKKQSEIAEVFEDLKNIQWEMRKAKKDGSHIIELRISDEELIEYHKVLKSIYDKYLSQS